MAGVGKIIVGRKPGMAFTDSEVRSLTATDRMQKKSGGDFLYIFVEPARKGGGKSFYGELRHPPGGGGKKVRVCIGPMAGA